VLRRPWLVSGAGQDESAEPRALPRPLAAKFWQEEAAERKRLAIVEAPAEKASVDPGKFGRSERKQLQELRKRQAKLAEQVQEQVAALHAEQVAHRLAVVNAQNDALLERLNAVAFEAAVLLPTPPTERALMSRAEPLPAWEVDLRELPMPLDALSFPVMKGASAVARPTIATDMAMLMTFGQKRMG
jgi:hypothetical protein